MVGPFLREYLSSHENMEDEDDEMRHLCTGLCETRVLACTMLERDPNKIEKVELESEDLQGMIRQPPKVGAIRFHYEPESTDTSHALHYKSPLQSLPPEDHIN